MIRQKNGTQLQIPTDLLVKRSETDFYLPASLDELSGLAAISTQKESATAGKSNETLVVPLVSEQIEVEKRIVETGKVVVHKKVHQHEQTVEVPLLQEDYKAERVPVNLEVTSPPPIRYEGDTMIIPVLEEVLVVEKRLRVKEELHPTRQPFTTNQPQTVNLRSEEIVVDKLPSDPASTNI